MQERILSQLPNEDVEGSAKHALSEAQLPDARGIFDPTAGLHYPHWHDDAYDDFVDNYNREVDEVTHMRTHLWSGEGDLKAKHNTGL